MLHRFLTQDTYLGSRCFRFEQGMVDPACNLFTHREVQLGRCGRQLLLVIIVPRK